MKLLLFFLLVCVSATNTKKSLIILHESVRDVAQMKSALMRAYETHISHTDFVSIAVMDRIILEWTSSDKGDKIRGAISNIPLKHDPNKDSTDYGELLNVAVQHKATAAYIIIDNMYDSGDAHVNTQLAKALTGSGTKVYPIGIGPNIKENELKRISGPCGSFLGCVAPFSYFHARDYATIKRNLEEKDLVESEETLTTTQIVLTVVISSIVDLLATWCLVYTCCFMPSRIEKEYRVAGISSRIKPRVRV